MKSSILLCLFFLALGAAARDAAPKPPENKPALAATAPMRAAQITQIDSKSRDELGAFFRNLRAAGIDTVIVRMFQNPGDGFFKLCAPAAATGYYFKTSSAPVVCDLAGVIADEAHKSGLKFYAWMNSRYADYGIEDRRDLHSRAFDFAAGKYLPARGLCIFHPEVAWRLQSLYSDLAQYPIDGVLIQDDLMLKHNEDFNPVAVLQYQKETGKRAAPALFYQDVKVRDNKVQVGSYTEDFWAWSRWKAAKLTALAERLRAVVRSRIPAARVGFNFYYETGLKPDKALAWFSQDVKMASARDCDFYSLMLYHRQMKSELDFSNSELDSAVRLASGNFIDATTPGKEPLVKLMTKDFKTSESIPETELERIIDQIPGRGRAGVAFFQVSAGMEKELAELIKHWGKTDESKNNVRAPAHSPVGGSRLGLQTQTR